MRLIGMLDSPYVRRVAITLLYQSTDGFGGARMASVDSGPAERADVPRPGKENPAH